MVSLQLERLPPEQQKQILLAEEKLSNTVDKASYIKEAEALADILEDVGLHEESRKRYKELLLLVNDTLSHARCWRKICFSFTNQRDYMNAEGAAETALNLFRQKPDRSSIETDEYFNLLIEYSLSLYFRNNTEKLEACVIELKKIISLITDATQRLRFFYSVSLGMLIKYRWYMLPEEAITHSQFYVHLATETGNPVTLALAKAGLAFVHLWREEYTLSREIFAEAIALLNDKNYGYLLMCYNYTTLGYRMQNNLSMTEKWTNLTLQKAEQTGNPMYTAMSYGNMAWLSAKRNSWLYAEDYARKGFEILRKMQPLYYTCSFPLIESLLRKNKQEEAGQYVYFMLSPKSKRLPDSVTDLLKNAAEAWVKDDNGRLRGLLEDLIIEAKQTGYY